MSNLQKLEKQAVDELTWFNANGYQGKVKAGQATSAALLDRCNTMFIDYIRDSWVPATLQKLEAEKKRLRDENIALGLPPAFGRFRPAKQWLEELRPAAAQAVTAALKKETSWLLDQFSVHMTTEFEALDDALPLSTTLPMGDAAAGPVQDVLQQSREKVTEFCEAANMDEKLLGWLRTTLEREDSAFKLSRFPQIIDAFVEAAGRIFEPCRAEFETAVHDCISKHLDMDGASVKISHDWKARPMTSTVQLDRDRIIGAITELYAPPRLHILQHGLHDCAMDVLQEALDENTEDHCNRRRMDVLRQINHIDDAHRGIRAITEVPSPEPAPEPEAAEAAEARGMSGGVAAFVAEEGVHPDDAAECEHIRFKGICGTPARSKGICGSLDTCNGGPASVAFNGSIQNSTTNGVYPNPGNTVTWTPANSDPAAYTLTARVYVRVDLNGDAGGLTIVGANGSHIISTEVGGNQYGWVDITAATSPLTSIAWSRASSGSRGVQLFAVELDGEILIDHLAAEALVALGGSDGSSQLSSCEVYDPAEARWEPIAPMGSKREQFGAAVLGGRLYALGGSDGSSQLSSCEMYDPAKARWEPIAAMGSKRHGAAAAVLDGRLYALGGWDGSSQLSSCEVYAPAIDRWEPIAAMGSKRHWIAATTLQRVV
jgi:hypothetical protein